MELIIGFVYYVMMKIFNYELWMIINIENFMVLVY